MKETYSKTYLYETTIQKGLIVGKPGSQDRKERRTLLNKIKAYKFDENNPQSDYLHFNHKTLTRISIEKAEGFKIDRKKFSALSNPTEFQEYKRRINLSTHSTSKIPKELTDILEDMGFKKI